jgi:hypothetical protein
MRVKETIQETENADSGDNTGNRRYLCFKRQYCTRISYPEPAGPFQLAHENVIKIGMRIIVYAFCSICIILACNVYLSDLQVLEIWDFGSTGRSRQAKLGRAKKPTAWEALGSLPLCG